MDSADDQPQSSSQGSEDKPYVNPVNWEATEIKMRNCCHFSQKNQSQSDLKNRF